MLIIDLMQVVHDVVDAAEKTSAYDLNRTGLQTANA